MNGGKRSLGRFFSVLLMLVLVGMLPVTAFAEESSPQLDVSRSKSATQIDENYTTDVTLSLPSAGYKGNLDVVLVVDNSFSGKNSGAAEQAADLIGRLSKYENLNIKLGVVVAGGFIPVMNEPKLETLTEESATTLQEEVKANKWKETYGAKGSNIDGAVQYATTMLDEDSDVAASDKHLILLSDGGTFGWGASDALTAKLFKNAGAYYWWNQQDFAKVYGEAVDKDSNKAYPEGRFEDLMGMPLDKIDANTASFKVVEAVSDASSGVMPSTSSSTYEPGNKKQFTGGIGEDVMHAVVGDDLSDIEEVSSASSNYITSREAAMVHAARSILDANEKYNVTYITSPYYSSWTTETKVSNLFLATEQFKDYLKNQGIPLYRTESGKEKYTGKSDYVVDDYTTLCETMEDVLVQVVDSGSFVDDIIGNEFELTGLDSLKLAVDGEELEARVEGDNVFFGGSNDSDYRYKVVYNEGEKSLKWFINEAISRDNSVQLTYTLKLTKPETAAGTYGQADLDGDGLVDGTEDEVASDKALYTNESAVLTPVDSKGVSYAALAFPKPSVSYVVKAVPGGDTDGDNPGSLGDASTGAPKTGDHSVLLLWGALLAVAVLGVVGIKRA